MAGIEDLLEYYIGKDPLYDIYKQKGLIDPSNIKAYEQDPRLIEKPWKINQYKQSRGGYTYSRDEDDPSLYIKNIDKFGMQPSGPLYGKSVMDDDWLNQWSYTTKDMGVDKFGNTLRRDISNREKITTDLNLPEGRFSRKHALSAIFGLYTDPQDIADYPETYGDGERVPGYEGGYRPTITERNKQIAETIGHEARHQVAGAGQTGYERDAQGNYIYPDFKVPSQAFSADLPDLGGQRKSELLNRMLDFQAYNDPRIYDDVYGTRYSKGTQGGKYTDTFGTEIKGMPRQLTSYQADALSDQATKFTNAMLAQSAPKYANTTGTADAYVTLPTLMDEAELASTPDNLAIKDFIPQRIKNLFSKKEDSLVDEEEGIPSTTNWQKFLSKITRQPYRGAAQGASGYTPAQLNSMNALGGYYSEPAREQRRERSRVANMLARQAAGKSYSQANLNRLTMGSRPGHYDPPGGGGAAADTSPSTPGNNPFGYDLGGLATMFERRR